MASSHDILPARWHDIDVAWDQVASNRGRFILARRDQQWRIQDPVIGRWGRWALAGKPQPDQHPARSRFYGVPDRADPPVARWLQRSDQILVRISGDRRQAVE